MPTSVQTASDALSTPSSVAIRIPNAIPPAPTATSVPKYVARASGTSENDAIASSASRKSER